MPLFSRILILVAPAALLLLSLAPPACATASPMPLPLAFRAADYSDRYLPAVSGKHHKFVKRVSESGNKNHSAGKHKPHSHHAQSPRLLASRNRLGSAIERRIYKRDPSFSDLLSQLQQQNDRSTDSSQRLQDLAASNDAGDGQEAASQLAILHSSLQAVNNLLYPMDAMKGLANYDKSNQLETTFKNIVNANKDGLTAVYDIINNDPTLGPLLGPTVYDIKCIVDNILNLTENALDGVLNALGPLLGGLLGAANNVGCSSGVKLLGFCLGG